MSFLEKFGLMTVARHDRIVAKADAVIDDAAQHLRAEEISAGRTLAQKVSLAVTKLGEARSNAFRNRQMALTLEAKVKALETELADLKAKRARSNGNLIPGGPKKKAAVLAERAGSVG